MIHGKRTTYRKQGCRCEPCTLANTRASKVYKHLTGAGRDGKPQHPTTVPGHVVRAHMDALYESGWITREIAAETGLSVNRVTEIRRGYKASRLMLRTASRILALDPLEPVTYDEAVVARLVDGWPVADWRDVGGRAATREERAEVLRRLDHRAQRAWLKAQGYGDHQIDLPSFDAVSRWLGFSSTAAKEAAA